jgi:hypothetical protein
MHGGEQRSDLVRSALHRHTHSGTAGVSESHSIHHPKFGEILKQRMDELNIECEFKYAQPAKEMPEDIAFFKKHFGLK